MHFNYISLAKAFVSGQLFLLILKQRVLQMLLIRLLHALSQIQALLLQLRIDSTPPLQLPRKQVVRARVAMVLP